VRQLSGALRDESRFELNAAAGVDLYATPGFTIAVLRHMAGTESARALLDDYRRAGLRAIENRRDDCAVVLFDETSRTLVLARDFVGMTPLYYGSNSSDIAFGTRMTDVITRLGLQPKPDRGALAGLLVFHDGPLPGTTYFEDVRAVPPGHILVKRGASIAVSRGAPVPAAPGNWSFEEASMEFGHLLRQAVALRISDTAKTSVLVSGGLDSAALLCLAASCGDVIGINFAIAGDAAADETRYVDALRRSGIPIERVPFYPTIDVASAEQWVHDTEIPVVEMVPLTHARAAARAVSAAAPTTLAGTWGDQVLAPFPPPHSRALTPCRVNEQAAAYHKYMTDVAVKDIAGALRRQAIRNRAPDWVLEWRRERRPRRTIFDDLAADITMFGPVSRIRSYRDAVSAIVSGASAQQGVESTTKWGVANGIDALLPFLDRDLLQLILTVPDNVAYHDHALKPLLRQSMKGIVPDEVLTRRDKGDYTVAMRRHSLPPATVLDILDGLRRPIAQGFISAANARKTLARIERGSDIWNGSDGIAAVFGLDVWLRLFIEK
jgi:asparagine synthase (glutamine-hydrolysing)